MTCLRWNEQSPVVRAARRVAERLRAQGHVAWWVGGCVRDALLGLDPKDIDVATDARPEQVAALFPHCVAVGAQFGVIVVMGDDAATEVTTFRRDREYLDSRHPVAVVYGSAPDDAQRRDFTINGLFYDPAEDCIHDYVGGRADLEARVLRAIGDPAQRFQEDALRLLRAVRFAVRFDLSIEPATWEALRAEASRIEHISAERIRDELVRMFTGPRPGEALRLLERAELLGRILPEVQTMRGVPQPGEYHPEGDVLTHTALILDHLPPDPSPALALGALLHDVGKPPTLRFADRIRFSRHQALGADIADAVCRRLRLSNADRKQIVALVRRHMDFINVARMKPARLRRFLAADRFDEHLALHRADCLASHKGLDNYEFCRAKLEEFARESGEPLLPPPLINGHDLIARGYPPGPRLGAILHAVREAQLNGELHSRDEALEWIARSYPLEPGNEPKRPI